MSDIEDRGIGDDPGAGQVVAAGKAVAESTANTAVITKLVRVMMLAPFLVALSAYLSRHAEAAAEFERAASLTCNAREQTLLLERALVNAKAAARVGEH